MMMTPPDPWALDLARAICTQVVVVTLPLLPVLLLASQTGIVPECLQEPLMAPLLHTVRLYSGLLLGQYCGPVIVLVV